MREKIKPTDDVKGIIIKLAEGVPGAMSVLLQLTSLSAEECFTCLLGLDDMNMRGSQIWVAYKDICKEDIAVLVAHLKRRDEAMVNYLNAPEQGFEEKAVTRGGSVRWAFHAADAA